MHVLIIHQAYASLEEPGGTRHDEFARLLAERGHRVTIIASGVSYLTGSRLRPSPLEMRGEPERAGVTVLRAAAYAAHHKSFLHRALAFITFMLSSIWLGLRVKNVDVVWGTSPPLLQGLSALLLARLKRAAFIFEVRDLWPLFAVAMGVLKSRTLIRISERTESYLYRSAECVIVNSPGFVSHVSARGARRVEIIPNGADPMMFEPEQTGARFRRALSLENKFVVMYAGAHGAANDLGTVLDCARSLMDRAEIQFVFVGDGKEKTALQRRAAELELSNVQFAESVPKSDMPHVLAASEVCIAILKPLEEYKLTYPNKVFDYMAAGRPIALAIDGVTREVVEEAGCGYFAQPGDAAALARVLTRFADDKMEARQMGMRGRQYLEAHFSREKIGAQLVRLFEEVHAAHEGKGMQ